MIRLVNLVVLTLFTGVFAAEGAGETGHLSADQLAKAVRSDSISIPTTGELFAALGKTGSKSKTSDKTSSSLQRRSELARSCLAAAIASTNSPSKTSGIRYRKNWKRRRTR